MVGRHSSVDSADKTFAVYEGKVIFEVANFKGEGLVALKRGEGEKHLYPLMTVNIEYDEVLCNYYLILIESVSRQFKLKLILIFTPITIGIEASLR